MGFDGMFFFGGSHEEQMMTSQLSWTCKLGVDLLDGTDVQINLFVCLAKPKTIPCRHLYRLHIAFKSMMFPRNPLFSGDENPIFGRFNQGFPICFVSWGSTRLPRASLTGPVGGAVELSPHDRSVARRGREMMVWQPPKRWVCLKMLG